MARRVSIVEDWAGPRPIGAQARTKTRVLLKVMAQVFKAY
jgi:hypothetical protein